MSQRLKVKEDPNLCRDVSTNGIVNTNKLAYEEHMKKRQKLQQIEREEEAQKRRINKLEQDVSELKSGINQILELLKK